jgi:hypothetical protein
MAVPGMETLPASTDAVKQKAPVAMVRGLTAVLPAVSENRERP